jgi:hypothetical protein
MAAGHCIRNINDETGTVRVIEIQTGTTIITEVVLLKYLQVPDENKRFTEFNDAKIRTINDAFEQLELPYRFFWEFDTIAKQESIQRILSQETPPDDEWWRTNIRWVNQIHPPRGAIAISPLSNFSLDCDYRKHWPIISTTYHLGWKYKRPPDDGSYNLHDLLSHLYYIFIEADSAVNSNEMLDDPKVYAERLVKRVEDVIARLDKKVENGGAASPK